MMQKKRIVLYAHYDPDDIVDDHIVYQIKSLHEYGCKIIFISNSQINNKEIILPYVESIIERENKGYDFYAWKECLVSRKKEYWTAWDEVILMNSSCYGPVFPVSEMFMTMDRKECDFWGITQYYKDKVFEDHINSYFIVLRKSIIESEIFWKYIASIKCYKSVRKIIFKYENRFTPYLVRNGYKFGTYINVQCHDWNYDIQYWQPIIYHVVPWLVKKQRLPFIKVKSFSSEHFSSLSLFRVIHETDSIYNTGLIIRHLRRVAPLSWQKTLPGTLEMINENLSTDNDTELKIGVIVHIHDANHIHEIIRIISKIQYGFDLLITTTSDANKIIIENALNKNNLFIQKTYIRVVENKGRDIVPWLTAYKDIHFSYDVALKIHIKISSQNDAYFTDRWQSWIEKSLIGSQNHVKYIIKKFENEEKLGIILPSFPDAFVLRDGIPHSGSIDTKKNIEKLFSIFDIKQKEENFIFSPGTIFWYRPEALRKLLEYDIENIDIPEEPIPVEGTILHGIERIIAYVANAEGYYYKIIIDEELLKESYINYKYHIQYLKPKNKLYKIILRRIVEKFSFIKKLKNILILN